MLSLIITPYILGLSCNSILFYFRTFIISALHIVAGWRMRTAERPWESPEGRKRRAGSSRRFVPATLFFKKGRTQVVQVRVFGQLNHLLPNIWLLCHYSAILKNMLTFSWAPYRVLVSSFLPVLKHCKRHFSRKVEKFVFWFHCSVSLSLPSTSILCRVYFESLSHRG